MHDNAPRRMDMHEPLAYSGARMGHALLRKRQDVAVSEAHIAFATWVSSVTIEPKGYASSGIMEGKSCVSAN